MTDRHSSVWIKWHFKALCSNFICLIWTFSWMKLHLLHSSIIICQGNSILNVRVIQPAWTGNVLLRALSFSFFLMTLRCSNTNKGIAAMQCARPSGSNLVSISSSGTLPPGAGDQMADPFVSERPRYLLKRSDGRLVKMQATSNIAKLLLVATCYPTWFLRGSNLWVHNFGRLPARQHDYTVYLSTDKQ